jgi:hypothetical protein
MVGERNLDRRRWPMEAGVAHHLAVTVDDRSWAPSDVDISLGGSGSPERQKAPTPVIGPPRRPGEPSSTIEVARHRRQHVGPQHMKRESLRHDRRE